MKTILFTILLGAAACGGGNKPAEPVEPMPTEPAPVAPTEAAAPSEPAPPPEEPTPDPEAIKAEALAMETAAYEKAKPVFEGFCKGCHVKGQKNASAKKLGELDITSYPFKGKHANTKDIREVLGIGGGKPTMPKGKAGAVKGDDLAAIAAWADAWDAAETAGAHAAADAPAETK